MGCYEHVRGRVIDYMNEHLLSPYMVEEAKKALFIIGDLKSPGLDGSHAIFWKQNWPLMGDDLVNEVLHDVQEWNSNTIVVIPKGENWKRSLSSHRLVCVMLCTKLHKKC